MSQKIRFSKKWVNPLFFEIQKYVDDPNVRRILVYGGKSSGKSFTIAQFLAKEAALYEKANISYRKEGPTIKTTIKETYKKAIESLRLDGAFEALDLVFRVGGQPKITLKGLDKEDKTKGVEGIYYLNYDELNDFKKGEFDQGNKSLRGLENQKIFGSWNPVSKDIWILKDFLSKYEWIPQEHGLPGPYSSVELSSDGKIVLIRTTYHDNYWIYGSPCGTYGYRDQSLIDEYEMLKETDPDAYEVEVIGKWGTIRTLDPWLYEFDRKKHILKENVEIQPDEPIWLSFDFNFNPTTVAISQELTGYEGLEDGFYILKEYGRKGGTQALCDYMHLDEELMDVPTELWTVTGDNSGSNRSSVAGLTTDYDVIQESFELSDSQFKGTVKRDKSFTKSRKLMNYFFRNAPVFINPQCENLIGDIQIAKPKAGDALFKDDGVYRMDYFDDLRYLIDTYFMGSIEEIKSFILRMKN